MNTEESNHSVEVDRVVLRAEIQEKTHRSSETIRRWIANAKLPAPDVDITLNTQGWRLSTLRAHGINWV